MEAINTTTDSNTFSVMRNLMRPLLLLTIFFFLVGFKNHCVGKRRVNITDIGWKFDVPEPLHFTDSAFNGKGAIKSEKWEGRGKDISFPLFSINNGKKGTIEASLWTDTLNVKQWEEYHRKDAAWYFQAFGRISTKKLLDTAYTSEVMNNQTYKRQFLKFYDEKVKDTVYLYHYFTRCPAKQRKQNLTLDISIAYTDASYGSKYLALVNSSSFSH